MPGATTTRYDVAEHLRTPVVHSFMDRFSILFEEIREPGFPAGWYYAIVPTLNLTTHGEGLEGARKAVTELLQAWLAEKRANGEEIRREPDVFFTQIEIPDALQV